MRGMEEDEEVEGEEGEEEVEDEVELMNGHDQAHDQTHDQDGECDERQTKDVHLVTGDDDESNNDGTDTNNKNKEKKKKKKKKKTKKKKENQTDGSEVSSAVGGGASKVNGEKGVINGSFDVKNRVIAGMSKAQVKEFHQRAVQKYAARTQNREKVLQDLRKQAQSNVHLELLGINPKSDSLELILSAPMPSFVGYSGWTGDLRPCYITPKLSPPEHIKRPDYGLVESGECAEEREARKTGKIRVHTEEEIQRIKHACKIGREVMELAGSYLKTGVTGEEIDRIVFEACIERNAYPSPLNYYRFPKSVCVSPNEVICHGIPDCRRIESGDIVNLDISVYVDGVHSDLNETFMVGEVDEQSRKLVKTAFDALSNAADMIQPGTMYRDLGAVITKTAAQGGCCVNKTYCGHGTGMLFHCAPNIPHYAKNKAVGIMRPGHIFTIEPMINQGNKWGDVLWPDDWTAVTLDGKRSAQFEHTFLVTETGYEILTARPGAPTDRMEWDEKYLQRP